MEPLISLLLPAITESVFGALSEAVGLSDWLRDRLKRDPEKLAFQQALTQALTDVAQSFPGRDLRYFAEVLRDVGGALLARALQPAASLPSAYELTQLWLNHLTLDSKIHYRQEFERFASIFLERLFFHLENQQPLQWIVQARRQRSSEEALQRTADATAQNAINLEQLRQAIIESNKILENLLNSRPTSIATEGGAYIGGGVSANNFAGRDLTIRNYFIQGLPRLVIDYSSRIQDFLLEYLGSKRKRVPFGGRQQQLDQLTAWLDDPTAPPYYLMSAEAGRGKSALVCRWLAQLTTRSDLNLIFVPISIRFETATQDVVFAALAARLANIYENEPEKLPPASLTAEQWKGVCQSYLRREPPTGKKLLVILDGLDEATGWTPGRGLFSSDPPEGLRVLVTARTRPGETNANGWATTLGWEDVQLARTTTLNALDRRGVEEALLSMGNPLDKLATKVDVVGELHRLSEGDPLLVRLYVDALVAEKERVAILRAEDLQSIKPGLPGYFERWWIEQKRQWQTQGKDPEEEQSVLRLLLDAIAASLGPIMLDDLAALHSDFSSSRLVRSLIQYVTRWLVGDGKIQGYSYSHPRLGYYFWELLGKVEHQTWDERFVKWGAIILTQLNTESLTPEHTPRYLLQHYAAHLKRVTAPPQESYTLISNGWRKAWEQLDISYGGFLNDIELANSQARLVYISGPHGRGRAIMQNIRYALCRTSIISLNNRVSPGLLVQLVQTGLLTPIQALGITKLTLDEDARTEMLIKLAAVIPRTLLGEVMTIIRTLTNESHCVRVIKSLAPLLTEEALKSALDIAHQLMNDFYRIEVLIRLVPFLSSNESRLVIIKVLNVVSETEAYYYLELLLPYLSTEQLNEILSDSKITKLYDLRNSPLETTQFRLPSNLIAEAVGIAAIVKDSQKLTEMLTSLSLRVPVYLFSEVLHLSGAILAPEHFISMIVSLIGKLSSHEREIALRKASDAIEGKLFQSNSSFVSALVSLAPYFTEEEQRPFLQKALNAAHLILDEPSRALALVAIAKYLPYLENSVIVDEAISASLAIKDKSNSVLTLVSLVPHLEADQQKTVLREALRVARTNEDKPSRSVISVSIAQHFSELERERIMREALDVALTIEDESSRATTLISLAKHLKHKEREVALQHALGDICKIGDISTRDSQLLPFASYLPRHEWKQALQDAVNAIRKIEDRDVQVTVLDSLNIYILENKRASNSLAISTLQPNSIHPLTETSPTLPGSWLRYALPEATSIELEFYRTDTLKYLARHLSVWAERQPMDAYSSFMDTLFDLTVRSRSELLQFLTPLMPFILALAGDEAPQAAEGIYHAIQEVCEWWP